ncbi:MAG TPA: hypothetical protein VFR90_06840 [Methylibium sp.]|nr:hypothetical protein [Methylibium sp.]
MKMAEQLARARLCGDPRGGSQPVITDAEIVSAVLRATDVQCITEEMRFAGLTLPAGLRCAFDLFVDGLATLDQVQAYLDAHLSAPVASLSPPQLSEFRHA